MKLFLSFTLSFSIFFCINSNLSAQGVTSGNLSGKIISTNGENLKGASVEILHKPTGTKYSVLTLEDGRFTISNLQVGGPYIIKASFIGYEPKTEDDIFINLGQTQIVNITLTSGKSQLQEVIVNAAQNKTKSGASTVVGNNQINRLPTIKRSFEDFARLNPQSQGFSFAGRNRLFNNLTIDGSIFTNPYGLDVPLPGGQANAQPISLDAIDQITVSISPFDVKQSGFTGASVNAVTKSGTNQFKGTAYHFFRNEALVGNKVGKVTLVKPNLDYNQSGLSFGGPIVKNKLFFFLSAELERRTEPAHTFLAKRSGLSGDNISNVTAAELDIVKNRMKTVYGYETGAYENYNHQTNNNKISAKIDWNVDAHNRFILSYKYLKAYRDVLPNPAISPGNTGRGPNNLTLPFEYNSYRINNNINSIVGELNSRYGKISNSFQVSYTSFNDLRESKSTPFPSIDITYSKDGTNKISLGLERFSIHNKLDQNVLQITNNLNYSIKNNTFTFGVNYEQFKFDNSFNLFYYPGYTFYDINHFLLRTDPTNTNTNADSSYIDFNKDISDANKKPFINSVTKFGQFGIYVQDEWLAIPNLKITAGLRVDIPLYLNKLTPQPNVEALTWYDTKGNAINNLQINKYPSSKPILSPRLGINYDIKGNKSTVLRGGTGIFLGRIPFVWLGNQSANQSISPGYTFQLNATANNFKFPKVWRTNIAVDQKLPWGIIGTIDLSYGQDINAVVHRNYNMLPPSQTLKPVGINGDSRPLFTPAEQRVNVAPNGSFLDAGLIVMENTNKGYQYTATVQVSKNIGNTLFLTTAYSYGISMDITSNPGEIAANAFQTNPTKGNPNVVYLAHSDHELKHRLILAGTYRKEYTKNLAFSIGLFGELTQGGPGNVIGEVGGRYSYTYAGDVNNDGITGNDLIFIPKDQSQILFTTAQVKDGLGNTIRTVTPAEQWNDLNAFINQDKYLQKHRGEIADRNGAITPLFARADLKLTHDFSFQISPKRKNTLQISFDILNFGNFLNKEWGIRKTASNRNPLILDKTSPPDPLGRPQFNFAYDVNGNPLNKSFINDTSPFSRWQAQFGIRYIF